MEDGRQRIKDPKQQQVSHRSCLSYDRTMSGPRSFACSECGAPFTVADSILARYPNWTPRRCIACRSGGGAPPSRVSGGRPTPAQVLERFDAGPNSGVFTDGFCEPNPGRGGWGAVKVIAGAIVEERHGAEDPTTNNRMELRALIEGYKLLGDEEALTVHSDSELCVRTINEWAAGWERKGWKRKGGAIKNLDLVRELYGLAISRPSATLEWIKGHAGSRWNEYADALSRVDAHDDSSTPANAEPGT